MGASAEKLKKATSSGMSKSWRWQEIMGGLVLYDVGFAADGQVKLRCDWTKEIGTGRKVHNRPQPQCGLYEAYFLGGEYLLAGTLANQSKEPNQ